MPTISANKDGSLPKISSSSESISTPSMAVPPSTDNPYIYRLSNPVGTVFIAVGSIVGAILLAFVCFHAYKSVRASMLAKKSNRGEKRMYEKYNQNKAYGGNLTPSTTNLFSTEYQGSVAKLPLLSSRSIYEGSQRGGGNDASTIHMSDAPVATSHHDLTNMFISPTKEVMTHGRSKSQQLFDSSLSLYGKNGNNEPPAATNRHSQLIPSLYINNELGNSDYSFPDAVAASESQAASSAPALNQNGAKQKRRTLPSMYLEDLIDK